MVYIKTRMRGIPDSCLQCIYHVGTTYSLWGLPVCMAVGGYGVGGCIIRDCDTTSERPKWCPLMER